MQNKRDEKSERLEAHRYACISFKRKPKLTKPRATSSCSMAQTVILQLWLEILNSLSSFPILAFLPFHGYLRFINFIIIFFQKFPVRMASTPPICREFVFLAPPLAHFHHSEAIFRVCVLVASRYQSPYTKAARRKTTVECYAIIFYGVLWAVSSSSSRSPYFITTFP